MRNVYIKMILMSLALGLSQISAAAEFASPDVFDYYEEQSYTPVITDYFPDVYGDEGHIILYEPAPRRRAPRVVQPPVRRPKAARLVVAEPPPPRRVRAPRSEARPAPVRPRRVRGGTCESLRPQVSSIVGAAHASCYLKLFNIESGCRPFLPQAAGNAGNPYAAYGLCSIERSPVIRRMNKRGAACNDIATIENQVRCCQSMMRKTPHYFGPVIHGKVPRCG